jgi:exosortase
MNLKSPNKTQVGTSRWSSRFEDVLRDVRLLAPYAAIVGAFAICYWGVFTILLDQWSTIDANSHGYLIPFLAIYLVWHRRAVLATLPKRPEPVIGAIVLGGGIAALGLGHLSQTAAIAELSMLPTLAGIVLTAYGWRFLGQVWMAILYLVFMMPLLDPFGNLHGPLQSLAATVGGGMLSLAGIPLYREGNVIYMPNSAIEVAQACSGVNNLVALVAIGTVIAQVTFVRTRNRVLFVGFAALIALFSNPVRVALIGGLLELGYDRYLPGTGHQIQGLTVSLLAFGALIGGSSLVARFTERSGESDSAHAGSGSDGWTLEHLRPFWYSALVCVVLLMLGSAQPALLDAYLPPSRGQHASAVLPGEWQSTDTGSFGFPGGPNTQVFRRSSGEVVGLLTRGLFAVGDDGGLGLSPEETIVVDSGEPRVVNRTALRATEGNYQVLYWYRVYGRVVTNRIEARLWGALGRLMRHPDTGTLVAVLTAGTDTSSPPIHLLDFAREIMIATGIDR